MLLLYTKIVGNTWSQYALWSLLEMFQIYQNCICLRTNVIRVMTKHGFTWNLAPKLTSSIHELQPTYKLRYWKKVLMLHLIPLSSGQHRPLNYLKLSCFTDKMSPCTTLFHWQKVFVDYPHYSIKKITISAITA